MSGKHLNIVFSRPAVNADGRVIRQLISLDSIPNSTTLLVGRLAKNDPIDIYRIKQSSANRAAIESDRLSEVAPVNLPILVLVTNPSIVIGKTFTLACKWKRYAAKKRKNLTKVVILRSKKFAYHVNKQPSPNNSKANHHLKEWIKPLAILFIVLKPIAYSIVIASNFLTKKSISILKPSIKYLLLCESMSEFQRLLVYSYHHESVRIIGNDAETLAITNQFLYALQKYNSKKKKSTKTSVHIDLHEYFPGQTGVKYTESYVKNSISLIHDLRNQYEFTLSTVSSGLASLYSQDLKIDANKIRVIWNSPMYDSMLNNRLTAESSSPKHDLTRFSIVHHGISTEFRKLDSLLLAIANNRQLQSRFEVHFYLVANNESQRYSLDKLKQIANSCDFPVYFHAPVSPDKISSEISKYDIAFCAIPPISISYANALPNKFFESVHAGLAILAGTSNDMCELIDKYGLGLTISEYTEEAIENSLNKIKKDNLNLFKKNSLMASQTLCFESTSKNYLSGAS